MAQVVVTLKIMPSSPKTDLKIIQSKAEQAIEKFGGKVGKVLVEPVAFGLNSLSLLFIMDESIGSTENLEKQVSELKNVASAEVTDVRRAVG